MQSLEGFVAPDDSPWRGKPLPELRAHARQRNVPIHRYASAHRLFDADELVRRLSFYDQLPDGHVFTIERMQAMSPAEINAELRHYGLHVRSVRRNTVMPRAIYALPCPLPADGAQADGKDAADGAPDGGKDAADGAPADGKDAADGAPADGAPAADGQGARAARRAPPADGEASQGAQAARDGQASVAGGGRSSASVVSVHSSVCPTPTQQSAMAAMVAGLSKPRGDAMSRPCDPLADTAMRAFCTAHGSAATWYTLPRFAVTIDCFAATATPAQTVLAASTGMSSYRDFIATASMFGRDIESWPLSLWTAARILERAEAIGADSMTPWRMQFAVAFLAAMEREHPGAIAQVSPQLDDAARALVQQASMRPEYPPHPLTRTQWQHAKAPRNNNAKRRGGRGGRGSWRPRGKRGKGGGAAAAAAAKRDPPTTAPQGAGAQPKPKKQRT